MSKHPTEWSLGVLLNYRRVPSGEERCVTRLKMAARETNGLLTIENFLKLIRCFLTFLGFWRARKYKLLHVTERDL